MKKSDLKFFSEEPVEKEPVVTYWAESSFDHDDELQRVPEYIVIGADFGDEYGTKTVATIDGMENLQAIKEFLELLKDPFSEY